MYISSTAAVVLDVPNLVILLSLAVPNLEIYHVTYWNNSASENILLSLAVPNFEILCWS